MITGESEPVEVTVDPQHQNPLEARNIVFNGSLVVDGSCLAVVIRTGDSTLIGTMVELTGDVGKASSTLKKDIEYFVKILTIFALIQAGLLFVVGLSRGLDPLNVFVQGFVTIMIANVPQGLPTTVTASLYLVAEGMAKQNVFVKKLDIIETLGSCTLICTDKTGTLTLNRMTVANLWVYNHTEIAEAVEKKLCSSSHFFQQLKQLLGIAVLNSRVVLEKKHPNDVNLEPVGDATELGFYTFCAKISEFYSSVQDVESFRLEHPKLYEIPFNSSFKWQMSIHRCTSNDLMFFKGAPDVLVSKCSHYLTSSGEHAPIDEKFFQEFQRVYEIFGDNGERVLGFAMKQLKKTFEEEISLNPHFKEDLKADLIGAKSNHPIRDLVFVGLMTLSDPPRPEVPQAVQDCHSAGIKVVMVTGDHRLTAAAIARKTGLLTHSTREMLAKERGIPVDEVPEEDVHAVVVQGSEISNMNEQDWKTLVHKKEIVFSRTSPEDKLAIVKEFTKVGNITAMTGDGVNDAPALKQAARASMRPRQSNTRLVGSLWVCMDVLSPTKRLILFY
jgi:sodium/potassium-transporting ATPase subunit alpha